MAAETILTKSAAGTRKIGARLAELSPRPTPVSLSGPLGVGKTTLVQGFARGAGVDPRLVHSPSFSIVHDYGPFLHLDLYRLQETGWEDLIQAGIIHALEEDKQVLIEWIHPLLIERYPPQLRIEMAWGRGEDERILTIEGIIDL